MRFQRIIVCLNVFLSALCYSSEKIILFSDVDGVIRESIDDRLLTDDMRQAIEALLDTGRANIIFISGSPAGAVPCAFPWQEDNLPISELFYTPFHEWIAAGAVVVCGAQGGQTVAPDGSVLFAEGALFSREDKERLLPLLLDAYRCGAGISPDEGAWEERGARYYQSDAGFRLIDRGCELEIQSTSEEWDHESAKAYLAAHEVSLSLVSGIAKREGKDFFFVKASTITKEECARNYLLRHGISPGDPDMVIVAFGDTQTDIGLYKVAAEYGGISFHFGRAGQYDGNPTVVRLPDGRDNAHTQGTLSILRQLQQHLSGRALDAGGGE